MRRASRPLLTSLSLLATSAVACGGWAGGTKWVQEPLTSDDAPLPASLPRQAGASRRHESRTLGVNAGHPDALNGDRTGGGGRVLGTFRNTYYDFPVESDYDGSPIPLMSGQCKAIAKVPRGFYDAVCVQGSGALARGGTVSFARRDCSCAEICPRTNQRICFDALDPGAFPWGRGAAGTAITPLRSVAADTQVLPLGTVLYIPELDGIARDDESAADGCFVVEDRGLKVQGEHVDIFTGHPAKTAVLNAQVPSNRGVTVVVEAPKCRHLAARRAPPASAAW